MFPLMPGPDEVGGTPFDWPSYETKREAPKKFSTRPRTRAKRPSRLKQEPYEMKPFPREPHVVPWAIPGCASFLTIAGTRLGVIAATGPAAELLAPVGVAVFVYNVGSWVNNWLNINYGLGFESDAERAEREAWERQEVRISVARHECSITVDPRSEEEIKESLEPGTVSKVIAFIIAPQVAVYDALKWLQWR